MTKYKVLKEFNLNGVIQKENAVIELDFRLANLKSIQENIEKAPDNTAPKDSSVFGNLIPGVTLTPEQKEKLAKENEILTVEAQRLAAEHRSRDIVEGKGEPAITVVANALKEKLANEEFESKVSTPKPVQLMGTLPEEIDPNNLPQ